MTTHAITHRRAAGFGGLVFALALLVGGPPATADLSNVSVPELDPGALPAAPTSPTVPAPTAEAPALSPSVGAVQGGTGAVAGTVGTQTGVTVPPAAGGAVDTVNQTVGAATKLADDQVKSLVGTVSGLLGLFFPSNPILPVGPKVNDGGGSGGGSDTTGAEAGGSPGLAPEAGAAGSAPVGPRATRAGGQEADEMASGGRTAQDVTSLRKAALDAAGDFAVPFMLGVLAVAYLVFQARSERHEPRLATDTTEERLRFR